MIDFYSFLKNIVDFQEVRYAVIPHTKLKDLGHHNLTSDDEKNGAFIDLDNSRIAPASNMNVDQKQKFDQTLNNKIFKSGSITSGTFSTEDGNKKIQPANAQAHEEIIDADEIKNIYKKRSGRQIRINLLRKERFRYATNKQFQFQNIVSVQSGSKHYFAHKVILKTPHRLSSIKSRAEPRNRVVVPRGSISGLLPDEISMNICSNNVDNYPNVLTCIKIAKKLHILYDTLTVE